MQVVIIGSGNVATVLGRAIKNAGHEIKQIYNRNILNANLLATELQAVGIDDFQQLYLNADIYLMALSDGAIAKVAKKLHLQKGILVHTAGAVSKNVLQNSAQYSGVLYPLQSLRKEKNGYKSIPLLVDGDSKETIDRIMDFAETLSPSVAKANDEERLKLHLAAVVVSNFTNYLYGLTENYCQKENVPFSVLTPLIEEVVSRLQNHHAAEMQTGPAIRKDFMTIEKHLALLENFPDLKDVYAFITKKITEQ